MKNLNAPALPDLIERYLMIVRREHNEVVEAQCRALFEEDATWCSRPAAALDAVLAEQWSEEIKEQEAFIQLRCNS